MGTMSNSFVINVLITSMLAVASFLRARGDPEQRRIFWSFGLPPIWCNVIGIVQGVAAPLVVAFREYGYPLAVFVSVIMVCLHAFRQGLPAAAVLDASLVALVFANNRFGDQGVDPNVLVLAALVGFIAYVVLARMHAGHLAAVREAMAAGKPKAS